MATYCNAHVLTFDYRGFGDSIGTPTEQGTVDDVDAMMAYVKQIGISNKTKVILYAESLGTGIAISYLNSHPLGIVSGLVLMAPFTSLADAALTHPITLPFKLFPSITKYM